MSISNRIRIGLERAIVRALIRECAVSGFVVHQVDDGGELVPVQTEDEAIEAVFAVDESRIRFRHQDDGAVRPKLHNVLLIGGNGEDIISDWHCGNPDFDAAVGKVAYNVEDLVDTVALKPFVACPATHEGKGCTRPEGHPYDEYGKYGDKHVTKDHVSF